MKTRRILMGALALAVVAATVIACTKEKETKVAQQATETEEVNRKPIATYDKATGQMTYYISTDQLQNGMDNFCASKGEDEYVVESWQITEEENETHPVLRYAVVNSETGSSISTGLFGRFVEKVEGNGQVDYFLSESFASGNYSFVAKEGEMDYLITVVDGEVASIEESGQTTGNRVSDGDIQVECRKNQGDCTNEFGCWPTQNGCTKCEPKSEKCQETIKGTFLTALLLNILASS